MFSFSRNRKTPAKGFAFHFCLTLSNLSFTALDSHKMTMKNELCVSRLLKGHVEIYHGFRCHDLTRLREETGNSRHTWELFMLCYSEMSVRKVDLNVSTEIPYLDIRCL